MGAVEAISAQQMRELGVREYLPHLFRDVPEGKILEVIKKAEGVDEIEAARLLKQMTQPGLGKFASQDFNRKVKGSLQQKAERFNKLLKDDPKFKGIVENDPWLGMWQYFNAAHRRIAYGSRFGFKGEMKDAYVRMAAAEGDNPALLNTILDGVLGNKHYDAGMRKLADTMVGFQIGTKMTMGMFPNMTQLMNTALFGGFKKLIHGARLALTGETEREIIKSVGLGESVMAGGLMRAFGREAFKQTKTGIPSLDRMSNASEMFAWITLRGTMFNSVERFNRIVSGGTGMAIYRDVVAKGVGGRLRGETLLRYRRMFKQWGLNLDDIVQQTRAGTWTKAMNQTAENRAVFRMAQLTQFTPSATRRPLAWNHPLGRVMFQFKNFALGQTRFLRDAVIKEASHGNIKPLAYFLAMYPIAGEGVRDVKAIIKQDPRDTNGIQRLWEDTLAVGGFGLATDIITSARFGNLGGAIMGPTMTDMLDLGANLVQRDFAGEMNRWSRMPVFQAGKALGGAALWGNEEIQQYLDLLDADTGAEEEAASLEEFRLRRARDK